MRTRAGSVAQWRSRVFTERRGQEIWRLLVALGLALLVAESWVASSGGAARVRRGERARASASTGPIPS